MTMVCQCPCRLRHRMTKWRCTSLVPTETRNVDGRDVSVCKPCSEEIDNWRGHRGF